MVKSGFYGVTGTSPWLKPPGFNPQVFEKISKMVEYKRNFLLYNAGDKGEYVYLILDGRVEHFIISEDGMKKITGISVPGCIVGELPMFDNEPHFCYARVCANSRLYRMTYHDFHNIIMKDTILINNILKNMAQKIRSLHTQIAVSEFCDASSKIAKILLFICDDYGVNQGDEILIGITFTHYDIAFMTGLSRVSVSNTLTRMARDGILRKAGKNYYIKNHAKLEELCEL